MNTNHRAEYKRTRKLTEKEQNRNTVQETVSSKSLIIRETKQAHATSDYRIETSKYHPGNSGRTKSRTEKRTSSEARKIQRAYPGKKPSSRMGVRDSHHSVDLHESPIEVIAPKLSRRGSESPRTGRPSIKNQEQEDNSRVYGRRRETVRDGSYGS